MAYIIRPYPPRRRRRHRHRRRPRPKRRPKPRPTGPPPEKRALLIGIEYRNDPNNRLAGCHTDVYTMRNWLTKVHGVKHFKTLMDDGQHSSPTKNNILKHLRKLLRSKSKKLYITYSGHGASVQDQSNTNNDERDGRDETLIPADFRRKGVIRDDTINKYLRYYLPKDASLLGIFDCCNSGTIGDLPYMYQQGIGETEEPSTNSLKLKEHNAVMISACKDNQTAVSAYNLEGRKKWQGALTHAIPKLDRNNIAIKEDIVAQLDNQIRKRNGFSQIATMSYTKQNPDLSLL